MMEMVTERLCFPAKDKVFMYRSGKGGASPGLLQSVLQATEALKAEIAAVRQHVYTLVDQPVTTWLPIEEAIDRICKQADEAAVGYFHGDVLSLDPEHPDPRPSFSPIIASAETSDDHVSYNLMSAPSASAPASRRRTYLRSSDRSGVLIHCDRGGRSMHQDFQEWGMGWERHLDLVITGRRTTGRVSLCINRKEAAACIGCSPSTINRWKNDGVLQPAGAEPGCKYYYLFDLVRLSLGDKHPEHGIGHDVRGL